MDLTEKTTDQLKFDWNWDLPIPAGRWLKFDIETNGLLPDVDTMHSLVITDLKTGEKWSCADQEGYVPIAEGLKLLSEAGILFGHNIIGYDIPVIRHLYPGWTTQAILRDTLVLCKMIWPMEALKQLDFPRWRKGTIPGQLIGAQKLEAWGYRLGLQKGEYVATVLEHGKKLAEDPDYTVPEEFLPLVTEEVELYGRTKTRLQPWKAWCRPMQDYCEVDVDVTGKLLELIIGHLTGTTPAAKGVAWSPRSVVLEHRAWEHCLRQEAYGYGFDLDKAVELAARLKNDQQALGKKLKKAFGWWHEPLEDPRTGIKPKKDRVERATAFPDVTTRRFSAKTGKELAPYVGPPPIRYSADSPFVPFRFTQFNPKSRQHLGDRLQKVYGWQPLEFGGKDGTQAKVDETTIKEISEDVLGKELKETILEYLVVTKTLGQLADGTKAWINLVADDGRIHGRVDTLGTISHRGAHKDPNLGQVPSVSVDEKKDETGKVVSKEPITGWKGGFGVECRSLFGPAQKGWVQTGSDAAGLELRMLGHYLWPYDNGEFARRVSTPGLDIHAENAKITGLSRADTKTTTYAFLYGAGALKIGMGVGDTDEEAAELIDSGAARSYLHWLRNNTNLPKPDDKTLALTMKGQQVKKKFLEGITGLKDLQEALKTEAQEYGFIVAIDGRKLSIRKAHATLNQALQGGGAIVCKAWMLELDDLLVAEGLRHAVDYGQMAWVHDEVQYEHRPGLEELVGELSRAAMKNVARSLGFRGELDTDTKSGRNWMDCH